MTRVYFGPNTMLVPHPSTFIQVWDNALTLWETIGDCRAQPRISSRGEVHPAGYAARDTAKKATTQLLERHSNLTTFYVVTPEEAAACITLARMAPEKWPAFAQRMADRIAREDSTP